MSRYLLIGGAGVFAIHTIAYLLDQPDTEKVISVGRNIERSPAYTLNIGRGDTRYAYHQFHFNFEQDRLLDLIDKEQPDYIINYAAIAYATSWENAHRYYETNLMSVVRLCEALYSRKFLKKFIQIGTSELYGSVQKPADEKHPIYP
ncbi:MAG: GDP-mannose 4,6-dehydratase, partial [Methylococcales bacterium]|nr:GDP-mannose 4,6-dehydratase [Methylococcales bacterium]